MIIIKKGGIQMNAFELAKQKRLEQQEKEKQEKEEKKNRQYDSSKYEEVQWMGLTQEPKVFRILGIPYEAREKTN